MKKRQVTVNKTEVLVKEREDKWYVPPSGGIPEYTSEKDPHCPTGQIRKYNEEKKLKADILAQRDKATSSFIKNTLSHSSEEISWDVNAKSKNDIRSKVKTQESYVESTILQKVIIREKLLNELQTLLKTQNDVSSCLSEVVELVKAIRFQTLDIIEGIKSWQQLLPTPQAFEYKGYNYLVKMKCDLDFLDLYEEVVEKFCFEFTSNPLAYRGGGNVITGYGTDQRAKSYGQGLLHNYYTSSDEEFLNGLSVTRLLNAEKIIQEEFSRLRRDKLSGEELQRMQQQSKQGDVLDRDIFNALSKSVTSLHDIDASNSAGNNDNGVPAARTADSPVVRGAKKQKKVRRGSKSSSAINPKKIKQERIAALQEEAAELKAMLVNVDEKVQFLTDHHHDLLNKRAALDTKLREAKAAGRDTVAQHINAEISVNTAVVLENSGKVKDLQRESYFINQERVRKLGTAQKLKEEIEEEKRRAILQKKIGAKIKKEGLLAALQSFSTMATVEQIATIGDKALGTRPKTPSGIINAGSPPKSAGNNGKRSKSAVHRSPDDSAASSPEKGSPTTYDKQDESSGEQRVPSGARTLYISASAPQFKPQSQSSAMPDSRQSEQNDGRDRAYGAGYMQEEEGDGEGDEEDDEDGECGDEYEYVDGNGVGKADGNGAEDYAGGAGEGDGYYDCGEKLQGESARAHGQYQYSENPANTNDGQPYQNDQWMHQQPAGNEVDFSYSGSVDINNSGYENQHNNDPYSYPAQDYQQQLYQHAGYQGQQNAPGYGNDQYANLTDQYGSNYNHQPNYQGENAPYEQAYGDSVDSVQLYTQPQGCDTFDNLQHDVNVVPSQYRFDVLNGADLEISPVRYSNPAMSSHTTAPISPSEASYGSKDSPLNFSYHSAAELSESPQKHLQELSLQSDSYHEPLVGEKLVATPQKKHRQLQFQTAENEMYISDDEEGHDHEQERGAVAHKNSVSTAAAVMLDPTAHQLTHQDHNSGNTFDLSEVSLSPLSMRTFDRSFDSDVGIVDEQGGVSQNPDDEAVQGPNRELFVDPTGADGAAYPAGNAYALVKSLKLSPRPSH